MTMALQGVCYSIPPLTNFVRSKLFTEELNVKRRISYQFATTIKQYFHCLLDEGSTTSDQSDIYTKLTQKAPKKFFSLVQYTLKTLHNALQHQNSASTFISDCFSIGDNTLWYEQEGTMEPNLTVQKEPKCLLVFATNVSFYPFEITVNTKPYRLHATFDSERCVYFDGTTWMLRDGTSHNVVDTNKVCGFIHKHKVLVYQTNEH